MALLIVGASLSACKRPAVEADDGVGDVRASPASQLALPVVGKAVWRGDLVLTVATTGQVRSQGVVRLKAEVTGTVADVRVRPGMRVIAGDPLVILDPRPLDLAVEEAAAAVSAAQVVYLDNIVPDSIVSGQPPSETRRRNALVRSGLEAARVRLEKAKLERERATIVAPFSGVVDQVHVAVGERVMPNQDIAILVDVTALRIEAAVLEHDLPLMRVGGQAMVTTTAAPDRALSGVVTAILPLVDSTTRAGRVLVGVERNGVLRPGMYADVRLEAKRLPDRVLVPARAVIERDGRPLVFVVKDRRAQWVYITPGRSNGTATELLPDSVTGRTPVMPGDTVLVEGHLTLTHDAPVQLVTDTIGPGR